MQEDRAFLPPTSVRDLFSIIVYSIAMPATLQWRLSGKAILALHADFNMKTMEVPLLWRAGQQPAAAGAARPRARGRNPKGAAGPRQPWIAKSERAGCASANRGYVPAAHLHARDVRAHGERLARARAGAFPQRDG